MSSTEAEANGLYKIARVPGKGLGVIATSMIKKGTRIMSESPLLRIHLTLLPSNSETDKLIIEDVAKLDTDKRRVFFALHNAYKNKTRAELGIARTNRLPMLDLWRGIFPEASRINHSCMRNAQHSWNEELRSTISTLFVI